MIDTELNRRLAWLIAVRAIISTVLLGSATLVQISAPGSFPIDPFYSLIALTYALDDLLRGHAAIRRALPLAGRRAAGRRRADRLGLHLPDRRRRQLLLAVVRAADRRRQHGAVPARRPAGRDLEHGALRRPGRWRSTPWAICSRTRCGTCRPSPCRRGSWRSTPWRSTCSCFSPSRCSAARSPRSCDRPARAWCGRRRKSPTCRRSTSTSSTACRAVWRPPIRSSAC